MNIASNIEHWALIDGYDNYEISSFGRVRNNQTSRILKGSICKGYIGVNLSKKQIINRYPIHRLVAFAFCENNNNYNIVDHIDRNPLNNHFKNLRWCTISINNKNKNIQNNNTSGGRGVQYRKDRNCWIAICVNDGKRTTKNFDNKDDAIKYRQEWEQQNGYICDESDRL
jgi:hypothetical protein